MLTFLVGTAAVMLVINIIALVRDCIRYGDCVGL